MDSHGQAKASLEDFLQARPFANLMGFEQEVKRQRVAAGLVEDDEGILPKEEPEAKAKEEKKEEPKHEQEAWWDEWGGEEDDPREMSWYQQEDWYQKEEEEDWSEWGWASEAEEADEADKANEDQPVEPHQQQGPDEYWNSPAALAAEHTMAYRHQVPWQQRGPPGPDRGGPSEWRGQHFRPLSRKWGTRGGTARRHFGAIYGNLPPEVGRVQRANALAKGKGKGKSKGKGKGSSSSSSSGWGGSSASSSSWWNPSSGSGGSERR